MRGTNAVVAVIAAAIALGTLGLQLWLGKQHLARQKADIARQQAELKAWQERVQTQPWLPMPMTPMVSQPPMFFTLLMPLLLAPMLVLAASEQQRLFKVQHEEEEVRTPYTEEDLMQEWEFKIIRSPVALFGQPAFLESVLKEEALAGWRLVEKFDGSRVRLKRLAESAPTAAELPAGYDPYRTTVGPQAKIHVVLWFLSVVFALVVPVWFLKQAFEPSSPALHWTLVGVTAGIAIALAFGAMHLSAKYHKLANRS